jgi:hypothetical protein
MARRKARETKMTFYQANLQITQTLLQMRGQWTPTPVNQQIVERTILEAAELLRSDGNEIDAVRDELFRRAGYEVL